MNTRKYIILAAITLAGAFVFQPLAQAADKADKVKPAAKEKIKNVAQELNLSKEQRQQLKPILKEEAEKAKALRDDKTLSKQERMEKIQAIRKELNEKIKGVLTPEQLEKWQKMREEQQAKRMKNSKAKNR